MAEFVPHGYLAALKAELDKTTSVNLPIEECGIAKCRYGMCRSEELCGGCCGCLGGCIVEMENNLPDADNHAA
jgi:hypothetical protein